MSHRQYSVQTSDVEKLNVRLLSISFSKDEKDWRSVLHTHPFTELFFVVGGEGKFLFRDKSYKIRTGDLVIVPPYMEHTEQSTLNTALQYYVIGLEGISFQLESGKEHAQVFCNFSNQSLISDLFAQMLYEIRNRSYGSDKICQNLLEILILRIIRSQHLIPVPIAPTHMTKDCAQIKEYLDANYADSITLDTLTELTHMNKYYMAHSFAKYTGQSPIQYLNQRRLEAACTLLRDTDHSISSIAESVGFSSQSYFTQAFRKSYNITPIRYRRENASSVQKETIND